MTLAAVTVTPLATQLDRGLRNARAAWSGRRGLLLQLLDSRGGMGQGEASPLPGYSPDSLEDCQQALAELDWGSAVAGFVSAPEPQALTDLLSQVPEQCPAARFALESALLDLLSDRHEAWRLLGCAAAPSEQPIPRSELLAAPSLPERIEAGRGALRRGVDALKVKVGIADDFEVELAELLALRRELGEGFSLRLDANQSWGVEEARWKLEALAPLRPELVEEPVPWTRLEELASTPVSIALDESLQELSARAALPQLAAAGLVQAVVLKPTVLGGLVNCLDLAATARLLGLGVIVTHTFEGPVAYAATVRLARLLPQPLPCGLAAHGGLAMAPSGGPRLCWST